MLITLLFSCVPAPALAADPPVAGVGMCSPGETEAFGCDMSGGKTLSICTSPDLAEEAGWIQYRFGVKGKNPELAFPAEMKGGQHDFVYVRYTRYMVTDLSLTFKNKDVTYRVFQSSNSEEGAEQVSEGIGITVGSAAEVTKECTGRARGSLMSLEGKVDQKDWGQ